MSILCYHAVEPGWRSALAVEPEAFDRQCAWLARHKTVLPLHQALDRLDGRGRPPRGTVVLTFDDGFRSVHDHALPILQRHRLPSTVFLVAQTLSSGGQEVDWVDHPPPYPLQTLTPDQVRSMQRAGVQFESHSWRHADLTTLRHDECVADLRTSRVELESLLGHPVTVLAYPRGRHNAAVRAAAAEAGYSHALALPEGPEPPGRYAVPRVGVHHGNTLTHLRVKTAGSYLTLRSGRAHRVGHAARRLVRSWS